MFKECIIECRIRGDCRSYLKVDTNLKVNIGVKPVVHVNKFFDPHLNVQLLTRAGTSAWSGLASSQWYSTYLTPKLMRLRILEIGGTFAIQSTFHFKIVDFRNCCLLLTKFIERIVLLWQCECSTFKIGSINGLVQLSGRKNCIPMQWHVYLWQVVIQSHLKVVWQICRALKLRLKWKICWNRASQIEFAARCPTREFFGLSWTGCGARQWSYLELQWVFSNSLKGNEIFFNVEECQTLWFRECLK